MIAPVPNPISYYPLETASSYLRRLCAANFLDVGLTSRALARCDAHTPAAQRAEIITRNLEHLGALSPGTITRDDDAATAFAVQPRCFECDRIDRPRWLCLQCAQGQTVEQVRHNLSTICLRHHRWAGPGTPPHHHVRIQDPALLAAERRFQQYELGRCATNVITARQIAADWALHTDPKILIRRRTNLHIAHLREDLQGEILTYPEAVGLMDLFADGTWLRTILEDTRAFMDIQAVVDERLTGVIPEHRHHATSLVMRALKPVIARYFHTHGPYRRYNDCPTNPPIPVWHHDLVLNLGLGA